jgi:hypothetical protein
VHWISVSATKKSVAEFSSVDEALAMVRKSARRRNMNFMMTCVCILKIKA